jgi:hypothetical protein
MPNGRKEMRHDDVLSGCRKFSVVKSNVHQGALPTSTTGDFNMSVAQQWRDQAMDTMGEITTVIKELVALAYELSPDEEYASFFNYNEIIANANNLLRKLGDEPVLTPDQGDLELAEALRLCEQWDGQDHARELENFDPLTLLDKTLARSGKTQ